MKFLSRALMLVLVSQPLMAQHLRQGFEGKVFWVDNSPVTAPSSDIEPQFGVKREILVYEPTFPKDVKQEGQFFSDVTTRLVSTFTSRPDGSFRIKLPPGNYSVFVREPAGLYANLFDHQNQINPVNVKPKQYTWVTILIDYQAAN